MSVSGVDDDGIGSSLNECAHTVERIDCHTHAGSHAQTAFLVLAGHWLVLGFGDVLVGNESHEVVAGIHNGQFLNLVALQNVGSGSEIGLYVGCHEILACHHVVDEFVEMTLETEVAVGDDTHEVVLLIHYGDTSDVVFRHDVEGVFHCLSATYCHGVVNHSVLGTLHDGHLTGLVFNRHVLVNHADTAFARYGDSHCRLGDGVHGSRNERHVQGDVTRELGLQLYRFRQYLGISGNKKDVIEGQTVHYNFICNK